MLPAGRCLAVVAAVLATAGCGGSESSKDAVGTIAFAGAECCGDPMTMPLDIWLIDADGGGARPLTDTPGEERDPSWSPDGTRLALRAGGGIDVVDADGGNRRNLAPNGFHPIWSPSEDVIAFARDDGGYVVNADGSGLQRIGEGIPGDWSPDGTKLAFVRDSHIYVTEADGSKGRRLSRVESSDNIPDWSPDGKKIAFAGVRGTAVVSADVYVMNADGTGERRLTKFPNGDGECFHGGIAGIDWSPDGGRIVFGVSVVGCKKVGDLYIVKPDGSDLTRLTESGFAVEPRWRPS
jgi:Tol biopolymer transport system component